MIVELTVENLAIIERTQITFDEGFTALTGETGAGKSLLIDAIELALGERADTELVRTGAKSASVHLVFDLSGNPHLLGDLVTPDASGKVYIDREVFAESRSQCKLNGRSVPLSTVREIGALLIDLHGQHDHQSLLNAERHIEFLDSWIGPPAQPIADKVRRAFDSSEALRKRLEDRRKGMQDREHRMDLLRFQITEIETENPQAGEMDELLALESRLQNVARLGEAAAAALTSLADEEGSALDAVSLTSKSLHDASRLDPELARLVAPIDEALVLLQDATHGMREYIEGLESDPARLEQVADRIDTLRRLRRKYGDDEAAVLQFLADARTELDDLSEGEISLEAMEAAADEARQQLLSACAELTQIRQQGAATFAKDVQAQLRDLAMDKALFTVHFDSQRPGPTGADHVEFFFSANAGEEVRPLSKIASGGEVSRVMLAIKVASSGRAGVPTLIFDEVDTGLGGRAAATVALKLKELARHYQVLVISHLPQIAAKATKHLQIEKHESGGRVATEVRALDTDERVAELARMLAGESVTESALANARELMQG